MMHPAGLRVVFAVCLTLLAGGVHAGSPNFGAVRTPQAPAARPEAPSRAQTVWEGGLNAYFGVSFTAPSPAALLDALAAHLNRRTLDGIPPATERTRFGDVAKALRGQQRSWRDEIGAVERTYGVLLDYLECEAAFHAKRDPVHLRRLAEIVTAYAALTPEYPAERAQYVATTIRAEQRFAPASVVFGVALLPWRPIGLAQGERLLEAPVQPDYTDEPDRAQALIELGCAPGPVRRIDFDTVDARRVELAVPEPAGGYRRAAQVESTGLGGVLSPLLVPAVSADTFRVTVWPQGDRPVLRNVRLFAAKPRPQLDLRRGMACMIDGRPDESPWPDLTWSGGFVLLGEPAFALSQTRFAAFHDQEALYIGVRAYEARMDTLAAHRRGPDEALWEEEAIEVRLQTRQGSFRFLVNPSGAMTDVRGDDLAWNGLWRAAAVRSDGQWQAEYFIPWETLGVQGPDGVAMNVLRYRHNVRDERSAWAVDGAGRGDPDAFVPLTPR